MTVRKTVLIATTLLVLLVPVSCDSQSIEREPTTEQISGTITKIQYQSNYGTTIYLNNGTSIKTTNVRVNGVLIGEAYIFGVSTQGNSHFLVYVEELQND